MGETSNKKRTQVLKVNGKEIDQKLKGDLAYFGGMSHGWKRVYSQSKPSEYLNSGQEYKVGWLLKNTKL